VLALAREVEAVDADERAGGLAAFPRGDVADVVLDAGLLDVGDGPRSGDEERGLLVEEQRDRIRAIDRGLEGLAALLADRADLLARRDGFGRVDRDVLRIGVAIGG